MQKSMLLILIFFGTAPFHAHGMSESEKALCNRNKWFITTAGFLSATAVNSLLGTRVASNETQKTVQYMLVSGTIISGIKSLHAEYDRCAALPIEERKRADEARVREDLHEFRNKVVGQRWGL